MLLQTRNPSRRQIPDDVDAACTSCSLAVWVPCARWASMGQARVRKNIGLYLRACLAKSELFIKLKNFCFLKPVPSYKHALQKSNFLGRRCEGAAGYGCMACGEHFDEEEDCQVHFLTDSHLAACRDQLSEHTGTGPIAWQIHRHLSHSRAACPSCQVASTGRPRQTCNDIYDIRYQCYCSL